MKNKLLLGLLIILSVFLISCGKNNIDEEESAYDMTSINVIIDGEKYELILEDNKTADKLVEITPFEVTMTDLNGYEKYIYLGTRFPVNQYQPGHIEKGDVMLFDNSCIVIFYKSVDLPFNYTKIGHIDNLDDLGSDDVEVIFEKSYK